MTTFESLMVTALPAGSAEPPLDDGASPTWVPLTESEAPEDSAAGVAELHDAARAARAMVATMVRARRGASATRR
jgi:hypothetical protein